MSILEDRCHCRLSPAHTLQDQLKAALSKAQELEQDLHTERVGRLLAEKRLSDAGQGGPRYTRNAPDLWPVLDHRAPPAKG